MLIHVDTMTLVTPVKIEGKTEDHKNAFLDGVVELVQSIFFETGGLDWCFGIGGKALLLLMFLVSN